jgi:hypothetical protein
VVLDRLLNRVEDGNAMNLAALAARRDAADDLRAVVEALLGQVDGLTARDSPERRIDMSVGSRQWAVGRGRVRSLLTAYCELPTHAASP